MTVLNKAERVHFSSVHRHKNQVSEESKREEEEEEMSIMYSEADIHSEASTGVPNVDEINWFDPPNFKPVPSSDREAFKKSAENVSPLALYRGISWSAISQFRQEMYMNLSSKVTVFILKRDHDVLGKKGTKVLHEGKIRDPVTCYSIDDKEKKTLSHVPKSELDIYKYKHFTLAEIGRFMIEPMMAKISKRKKNRSQIKTRYIDILDGSKEVGDVCQGYFLIVGRQTRFEKLFSALKAFVKDEKSRNPKLKNSNLYFWLDIFCTDCGLWRKENPMRYENEQKKNIKISYKAASLFDERIIFFNSWIQPAALTRFWCLWQLYSVVKHNRSFKIIYLSENDTPEEPNLDYLKTAMNEAPKTLSLFPHFFEDDVGSITEKNSSRTDDKSPLSFFSFMASLDFQSLESSIDFDKQYFREQFSSSNGGFNSIRAEICKALYKLLSHRVYEIVKLSLTIFQKNFEYLVETLRRCGYFFMQANELNCAQRVISLARQCVRKAVNISANDWLFVLEKEVALYIDHARLLMFHTQPNLKKVVVYLNKADDKFQELSKMAYLSALEGLVLKYFREEKIEEFMKSVKIEMASYEEDEGKRFYANDSKIECQVVAAFEEHFEESYLLSNQGSTYSQVKNIIKKSAFDFRNKEFENKDLLKDYSLTMAKYELCNQEKTFEEAAKSFRRCIILLEETRSREFEAICRRIELAKEFLSRGSYGTAEIELQIAVEVLARSRKVLSLPEQFSLEAEISFCLAKVRINYGYYTEAKEYLETASKFQKEFTYGVSDFEAKVATALAQCKKHVGDQDYEEVLHHAITLLEQTYGKDSSQAQSLRVGIDI